MSMKTKYIMKFVLCFIVTFLFVEGIYSLLDMELSNVVKGIIVFALSVMSFNLLFVNKKPKT